MQEQCQGIHSKVEELLLLAANYCAASKYPSAITVLNDILEDNLAHLHHKQTTIIFNLALQSIHSISKVNKETILTQSQDQGYLPESIIKFNIIINGISSIFGVSIAQIITGCPKDDREYFLENTRVRFEEYINEKIGPSKQKKNNYSVVNQIEYRELLCKYRMFGILAQTLQQEHLKQSFYKKVQIGLVNHKYMVKLGVLIRDYPEECEFGSKQGINESLLEINRVWIKKVELIADGQSSYFQEQQKKTKHNFEQIYNLLERLYMKALKKVKQNWNLTLKFKIYQQQARNFRQTQLNSEQKSETQTKLMQLKAYRSQNLQSLLPILKASNQSSNPSHFTNQPESSFRIFLNYSLLSEEIANIQIQYLSQLVGEFIPFVSFGLKWFFELSELESFVYLKQFEQFKNKLKQIQQKHEYLVEDINTLLTLFSTFYNVNIFRSQQEEILQKFCHCIRGKIDSEELPLYQQTGLVVLLTWIQKQFEDLQYLEGLATTLTQKRENTLIWYNLTEKIYYILFQEYMTRRNNRLASLKALKHCIQLIKEENNQQILNPKYTKHLLYLKIRKQKHFRKVNRQIDFRKYINEPEKTSKVVEFESDEQINQFWQKQKETIKAQYLLSLGLILFDNLRNNQKPYAQEKQIHMVVQKALEIWEKYEGYNLNSISRIKIVRYWLNRNMTVYAYRQLKKIKHYKPEDINFYSVDCYFHNEKIHEADVKQFQSLIKQIQFLAIKNVSQQQTRNRLQQILQNTKQNINFDTLTVIMQTRMIRQIKANIEKEQMIKSKLKNVNESRLSQSKIAYESLFYPKSDDRDFFVYNYQENYKENKIIVYESNFHNPVKALKARKIIENIWTISHQNICGIEYIQDIMLQQSQFRVYLELQGKEVNCPEVNFQKLIKRIIQTIFHLGRYIPRQVICNPKSLHFLSTSQFQINPLQSFVIKEYTVKEMLNEQNQLLKKAKRQFFKQLKILNRKNSSKQKLDQYILSLFDQYLEHISNKKILFHKDLQAALYHPFFWNHLEISKFIDEFQSEMQYISIGTSDDFKNMLNAEGKSLINGDWGIGLDPEIDRDIVHKESLKAQGKYRGYKWNPNNYEQISYLVNCIRNSIHHFIENNGFGKFMNVEEIVSYYLEKHPKLVSFLWEKYDILHRRFKKKFPVK